MVRAGWGILVVATVVVSAVLAAFPVHAGANYYRQYNCGRMAPNSWCLYNSVHTWDQNAAGHSYAIALCEKLITPNQVPDFKYSYRCAFTNHVTGFSDDLGRALYPNTNTGMWPLVANGNNSFYATVEGAADAG